MPLSRMPLQQRNLDIFLTNFLKLLHLTKCIYHAPTHWTHFVYGADLLTLKLGFCGANCRAYEKYSSLATAIADKCNSLKNCVIFQHLQ